MIGAAPAADRRGSCAGSRGGSIRLIDRFLPRRVSVAVGVVLTIVLVVGVIQGFLLDPALDALNSAYSVVNTGTEPGVSQPTQPERSGSPASLVPWNTLGVQGRDFTGIGKKLGPTVQQISEFNGAPAEGTDPRVRRPRVGRLAEEARRPRARRARPHRRVVA